jgi:hypothetical protein
MVSESFSLLGEGEIEVAMKNDQGEESRALLVSYRT